ncbi:MAG: hypothetical protein Q8942_04590 [Bacillota bacterium]|nr:hypothetical protein [Bacillota bacterium]
MNCNFSHEEIDNYFEGEASVESSKVVSEHLKTCEECKVYYSSLVMTGKLIDTDIKLQESIFKNIENRIDRHKYRGKRRLYYKFTNLISRKSSILKPALALILLCFITIMAIGNYSNIIGSMKPDHNKVASNPDMSTEDVIKTLISSNGGFTSKLLVQSPTGSSANKEDLEQAKSVIIKRLNILSMTQHEVNVDLPNSCLNITGAWINKNNNDFKKTLTDLTVPGKLTFQETDTKAADVNGKYPRAGEIICDNNDIVSADYADNGVPGQKTINIKFNAQASAKFAEATKKLLHKQIGIFMDDNLLVAPVVQEEITDGNVILSLPDEANPDIIRAIISSKPLLSKVEITDIKFVNN